MKGIGEGEGIIEYPYPKIHNTMSKKILIDASQKEEFRVAIVKDGILEDFYIQTLSLRQKVGNIYKGIVENIDHRLQACFVNFGQKKNGFLPTEEIHPQYWAVSDNKDIPIDMRIQKGQEVLVQVVKDKILYPVLWGMESRNIIYKGVLYAGLMITSGGPKVLEFNCRFGDPETQAVLPLIESDFVELLLSSVKGTLKDYRLKIRNKSAVNVVIASGGYPGKYEKGKVVFGYKINEPDVMVFHAGTAYKGKDLVTSGGRVISVTAVDNDIKSAVKKAYNNVGKITFDGAYYRKDIAHRALKR